MVGHWMGIAGCGTSTLGACGLSMLAGFCTLGTGGYTIGGRRSSHLYFLICWGGRQLFRGGVSGPVGERVFQILKITDLVT